MALKTILHYTGRRFSVWAVFAFLLGLVSAPCQANDTLALAMASLQQAYQKENLADNPQVLQETHVCDSLLQAAKQGNDTAILIEAYLLAGDSRFRLDRYASAYAFYDSALYLAEQEKGNPDIYTSLRGLYLRQGEAAYFLGKYLNGVEYLYKLLQSESTLNPAMKMQAYIRLGNLFIRLGKNDLAIHYLDAAHQLQKEVEAYDSLPAEVFPVWQSNDYPACQACGTDWPAEDLASDLDFELNLSYSSAYWQKNEHETSVHYIEKAKKSASAHKLNRVYQNISIHHLTLGDLNQSERFCLLALRIADKLYEQAVILNNYAVILLEQGKIDSALTICQENMKRTSGADMYHVRSNLYFILSRIYEAKGMYKEALDARRREQAIWDSVYNQDTDEKIWQLNKAFETNRILRDKEIVEYQLKLTEVENSRKNILIALLALISCLVIFLIIVIVKKLRKQRESVSHLEEQIVHIHEDNRKIMESSKAEFENVLTAKTQELTANTMYIAKMCDMANQILAEVHKLEPFCTKKESKELLLTLQKQVASLTIEERGWNDFKLYFEQIHPAFFDRLNASHPDLTAGENRLCAFIVMNLTTKEISALTNRSVRTIETAKFRLRKKLGITKETGLLTFLHQFTR